MNSTNDKETARLNEVKRIVASSNDRLSALEVDAEINREQNKTMWHEIMELKAQTEMIQMESTANEKAQSRRYRAKNR